MTCRKVIREKVTGKGGRDNGTGEEVSRCDRRKDEGKKEVKVDVTKRKSITGMVTKMQEKRKNTESGRGKVSNLGDGKRRCYSEAVVVREPASIYGQWNRLQLFKLVSQGGLSEKLNTRCIDKDSTNKSARNTLDSSIEFVYNCVCLNARSIVNKKEKTKPYGRRY